MHLITRHYINRRNKHRKLAYHHHHHYYILIIKTKKAETNMSQLSKHRKKAQWNLEVFQQEDLRILHISPPCSIFSNHMIHLLQQQDSSSSTIHFILFYHPFHLLQADSSSSTIRISPPCFIFSNHMNHLLQQQESSSSTIRFILYKQMKQMNQFFKQGLCEP